MTKRTAGRSGPALLLALCLLASSQPARGQLHVPGAAPFPDPLAALAPAAFEAAADSVPDVRGDSLPEHMPLVKRVFWGRSGLVRVLGLDPRYRSQELGLRRQFLQWHQRLGLLTWGAMTAQAVTGGLLQSNLSRHYGGTLHDTHRVLGYTTYGLYSLTASFSLVLAPPARRYSTGFSSIRLHRWLPLVHFTGMMVQPWLGRAAGRAANRDLDPEAARRYRNLHKWTGIATYAAFTGAVVTILVPY